MLSKTTIRTQDVDINIEREARRWWYGKEKQYKIWIHVSRSFDEEDVFIYEKWNINVICSKTDSTNFESTCPGVLMKEMFSFLKNGILTWYVSKPILSNTPPLHGYSGYMKIYYRHRYPHPSWSRRDWLQQVWRKSAWGFSHGLQRNGNKIKSEQRSLITHKYSQFWVGRALGAGTGTLPLGTP